METKVTQAGVVQRGQMEVGVSRAEEMGAHQAPRDNQGSALTWKEGGLLASTRPWQSSNRNVSQEDTLDCMTSLKLAVAGAKRGLLCLPQAPLAL